MAAGQDVTAGTWRGLPIEYTPTFRDPNSGVVPRPLKASEVVARRIIDDLISEGYSVGDRFPSEAEMLEHYEVSRETLREGLRLLEVQGLLSIRRGPGGGPFVTPVNAAFLARSASLFFHVAGATYDEVFEAWLHLEPALVARVARSPDREPVEQAMAVFLDPEGPPLPGTPEEEAYFNAVTNFHGAVSRLAGNRVLTLLSQAVDHIVTARVIEDVQPLRLRSTIDADHADIAAAILRGHARKAEALAYEHIAHVRDHFFRQAGVGDEVVVWR
ncbi:FadR family transcriptional regulator [Nitriliruptoraceae bacterium ZYF776]|nr:FadR family transcriptional regulator [Profundirhabdus halotolerans]